MPENFRVSRTRRIVKKSMLLALPLILALLAAPAIPQGTKNNYPTPPPPLNSTTREKEPATLRRRVDLAKLQREADELSRMSQTIPSDVASVRKGMLPRDVIEKLKQIEKLSKRLRTELNP
jgi:hypothetical protein